MTSAQKMRPQCNSQPKMQPSAKSKKRRLSRQASDVSETHRSNHMLRECCLMKEAAVQQESKEQKKRIIKKQEIIALGSNAKN